jgi:hypothetical protein
MKAKLSKAGNQYLLRDFSGEVLASTNSSREGKKISKQNCDDIFGVVDVEKLAEDFAKNHSIYPTAQDDTEYGFKQGFKKAMELNKGKVFTEKQVRRIISKSQLLNHNDDFAFTEDYLIESESQPTEIEVEIEMICPHPKDSYRCGMWYGCDTECYHPNKIPYLDSEGYLILKKI